MSNAFLSTNTAAIEEGKLKLAIRDGVELEKGVVITEEYLKQHEDLFIQIFDLWVYSNGLIHTSFLLCNQLLFFIIQIL